jgi:hypothetical protein
VTQLQARPPVSPHPKAHGAAGWSEAVEHGRVEEGARAILNLATSPAVEGQTGLYFNGLREAKALAQAYDPDARRRLQALSLELTGLSAEGVAALDG